MKRSQSSPAVGREDPAGASDPSLCFEWTETIGGRPGLLTARFDVVRLEGGELAVLKDLSGLPDPFRRAIGRVAVRRERRAYERLAGLAGIPRLLEARGPFALLLERVRGTPLTLRHAVRDPSDFVPRLEGLLARVHARGVSHGEIRLANVLADREGAPWLVDFATASVVDPPRRSLLFRVQCRLDRYGWLMIKQHLTPGSLTPGERDEQHQTRLLAALFRHHVV
jgi:hypothetical protein